MDTNEMGLPFFPNDSICNDSPILKIIHDLYSKMHGNEVQRYEIMREIDRYWFALFLQSIDSPLTKRIPWHSFVLKLSDVFSLDQLPDIGPCIRQLSLHRNISNNVMCRIIQYSLPYVKHNRLNFPRYVDVPHTELVDLIQITLAMLLSIYPHCTKQALWQLRFKIYIYIYHLLSRGNKYDQYTWCLNNINLIRIAMVEYFVYFVSTNMPAEYEILQTLFGCSGNVEVTFRQFLVNVEYFRTQNLQTTDLNWENIHKKSHYIIERCNRLCKAKPKLAKNHIKSENYTIDSVNLKRILDIPRCTHPFHAKIFNPNMTFDDMKHVYHIHRNIFIHVLPRSVFKIQAMLGQIVSIFSKNYYFCHECLMVHEWKSIGVEFFKCPFAKKEQITKKSECILCKKNVNVNTFHVLDSKLGVMQSINLCLRHSPRDYQMKYIHSLHLLFECLRKRHEARFGIV
jgi:hypothetical protein